jgi:hypothetical protein
MRRIAAAALAALGLLALPAGASAAVSTTNDPTVLAGALGNAGAVGTASFAEQPGAGTPYATGNSALAGFPTEGGTFAILTTGDASIADTANTSTGSSNGLGSGPAHGFAGAAGNAFDTSVLQIPVTVPAGATCMSLDYKFFSEEWPENVGFSVNDGFLVMLDTAGGTADPVGDISAPTNFAFDGNGALISVNTADMTAENAAGTTYDGATALLTARHSVSAGAHTLYLTIFDQGDQALDSAAFVDNLQFDSTPAATCDGTPDRAAPSVTVTAPANDAQTDPNPLYAGTAGTGATDSQNVTVQVYSGTTVAGAPVETVNANRQADGSWSVSSNGLGLGTYTVQAHQTDTAGNLGVGAPKTFTVVDTIAPAPSIGTPSDGDVSADDTPTVSGTAGLDATDLPDVIVDVYAGDTAGGVPADEVHTTAVDGDWSTSVGPLANGVYTVTARQSDQAGNEGTSDPVTFTVDDQAPTVRITVPADGSTTEDTTPAISGTAGDAPGDSAQVTVTLHSGGAVVQTLDATRSGTAWSVRPAALGPGDYTAVASQNDTAGNVGASPAVAFSVTAQPTPTPTPSPQQQVDANTTPSPEPVLGQTVVAGAVGGGTVRIKDKNGRFRTLGANESIPLGSTIDATKGRVRLTSASGSAAGQVQTADFYQGAFVITQTGGSKPITQLALTGALACPAKGKASAAARRKKVRRLWGDGHGRFRTKGRRAAATVRGTKWLTEDRCDSTKITVKRGVVLVRDFVKRKNVVVKKGHSYVARTKNRKKK